MAHKGFFVTGTDTGVGKTVVSGVLIRGAYALGQRACGMKPIETGCTLSSDVLIPHDGSFLKDISYMQEQINHVTPYRMASPLAPLAAAIREGVHIDPELILDRFLELQDRYDAVVVEGVGGLLVPIKRDYFMVDLMLEMCLPVVVVARPSLGTINHTLLTVEHALKEGLEVAGVIFNYNNPPDGSLAEKTNPLTLKETCAVPLLGTVPHLSDMSSEALQDIAVECLEEDFLRHYLLD